MSTSDVACGCGFPQAVLEEWQRSTRKPTWPDFYKNDLGLLRQVVLEDALMRGKSGKVLASMVCLIEALYQRTQKEPLVEKALRTLEDLPVSFLATIAEETLELAPRLNELLPNRDIGGVLDALAPPTAQ